MLSISIITPTYSVLSATDVGCIKAAITMAKYYDRDLYIHNVDGRHATVQKWGRWDGEVITIKKPRLRTGQKK